MKLSSFFARIVLFELLIILLVCLTPSGVSADSFNRSVDATAPVVKTFTVTSSSNSLHILVKAFNATDDVGVTGYMITRTSIPPSAGTAGWSGTPPTSNTVASDGTYTLYPWVKDAAGHVSAVFNKPPSVTVDATPPSVTINQAYGQADPTIWSLNFTVVFSEAVTGFTASDVVLSGTKAAVTNIIRITGGPTTYNVDIDSPADGTMIASIPAGSASDAISNPNTASTSIDNTITRDGSAPIVLITKMSPEPTTAGANATWHSDENGTYRVRVGGIDCSTGIQVASGNYSTSPEATSVVIPSAYLAEGDNNVMVCVTDTAGNTGFSSWPIKKVLTPILTNSEAAPIVTTNTATSVGSESAIIHGTVNAKGYNSFVSFEYGTRATYAWTVISIPASVNGSSDSIVTATLTGLNPHTTYHYRVVASNINGLSFGLDKTFTTTD
jgi:hypothetical protein